MGLTHQDDDEWPAADAFRATGKRSHKARSGTEITEHENEVMTLVAQGWSNEAIATELGISNQAVKNRLSNVYSRMDLDRRDPAISIRVAAVARWLGLDGDLTWNVRCEFCIWGKSGLDTRRDAVTLGDDHVAEKHKDAPEYAFRVQGVRKRS